LSSTGLRLSVPGGVRVIPLLAGYAVLMVLLGRVLPVEWILPTTVTLVAMFFCLSIPQSSPATPGSCPWPSTSSGGLARTGHRANWRAATTHWPFVPGRAGPAVAGRGGDRGH